MQNLPETLALSLPPCPPYEDPEKYNSFINYFKECYRICLDDNNPLALAASRATLEGSNYLNALYVFANQINTGAGIPTNPPELPYS